MSTTKDTTSKIQVNMESIVRLVSEQVAKSNSELTDRLLTKMSELLDQKLEKFYESYSCANCASKTVPASHKAELVKDQKAILLGDSITKDLGTKGVAKIAGQDVRIRSKGGAVPADVLEQDLQSPQKIILHAGTNLVPTLINSDVNMTNKIDDLTKSVTDKLDDLQQNSEDSVIYYSSMLKRTDMGDKTSKSTEMIQDLIKGANEGIREHCTTKNYKFINNSNIDDDDLFDGLHLNQQGATKFSKNVGNAINDKRAERKTRFDTSGQFVKLTVSKNGERPSQRKQIKDDNYTISRNQIRPVSGPPLLMDDYWPYKQYNDDRYPYTRRTYRDALSRPNHIRYQQDKWPYIKPNY